MTDQQIMAELKDHIDRQKQLIADITEWHMIECPHGQRIVELEAEVGCLKEQIYDLIYNA